MIVGKKAFENFPYSPSGSLLMSTLTYCACYRDGPVQAVNIRVSELPKLQKNQKIQETVKG